MLLKLTEDVAQHPLPVVHGHKNGRIFIVYFLTQLGIRVLSAPGPEEIRPPGVMHLSHLSQKLMDAGDVSLLCSANSIGTSFLSAPEAPRRSRDLCPVFRSKSYHVPPRLTRPEPRLVVLFPNEPARDRKILIAFRRKVPYDGGW